MAGFALAAPLIALTLAAVVSLSGALWQREVAAALLSRSVARAAATGGSLPVAEAEFRARAASAGLKAKEFRWQLTNVNGVALLEASVLVSVGGGLVPAFDSQLRSRATVG